MKRSKTEKGKDKKAKDEPKNKDVNITEEILRLTIISILTALFRFFSQPRFLESAKESAGEHLFSLAQLITVISSEKVLFGSFLLLFAYLLCVALWTFKKDSETAIYLKDLFFEILIGLYIFVFILDFVIIFLAMLTS